MTIILIILGVILFIFVYYLFQKGARKEHFGKAALETLIIYVISNLPIWILILVSIYDGTVFDLNSLVVNMNKILKSGDVFIYISAILAPVAWTVWAYFKDTHRVLMGAYGLALIIVFLFSAISFQQVRLTEVTNQNALDNSAILLYGISLILWYGSVVYTKFIDGYQPNPPSNPITEGLK